MSAELHSPGVAIRPLVVWRFTDGKRGHERQTEGLLQALADHRPLDVHGLDVRLDRPGLIAWLSARFPAGEGLPKPDLLLGAGHATHLPMLAARRRNSGRIVVLMKPSLPLRWFDLCVIPEHDAVKAQPNVFITRGVLNPMRPAEHKDPRLGLILIGGPSKHYGWSDRDVWAQILEVLQREPEMRWVLTTSRRTPTSFFTAKPKQAPDNFDIVPYADTGPDWLPQHLANASRVWVGEDSVSMVYEALTAGAAVGVLTVPLLRKSRVAQGVQHLITQSLVVSFDEWSQGKELAPPSEPFNEAVRCAGVVLKLALGRDAAGNAHP